MGENKKTTEVIAQEFSIALNDGSGKLAQKIGKLFLENGSVIDDQKPKKNVDLLACVLGNGKVKKEEAKRNLDKMKGRRSYTRLSLYTTFLAVLLACMEMMYKMREVYSIAKMMTKELYTMSVYKLGILCYLELQAMTVNVMDENANCVGPIMYLEEVDREGNSIAHAVALFFMYFLAGILNVPIKKNLKEEEHLALKKRAFSVLKSIYKVGAETKIMPMVSDEMVENSEKVAVTSNYLTYGRDLITKMKNCGLGLIVQDAVRMKVGSTCVKNFTKLDPTFTAKKYYQELMLLTDAVGFKFIMPGNGQPLWGYDSKKYKAVTMRRKNAARRLRMKEGKVDKDVCKKDDDKEVEECLREIGDMVAEIKGRHCESAKKTQRRISETSRKSRENKIDNISLKVKLAGKIDEMDGDSYGQLRDELIEDTMKLGLADVLEKEKCSLLAQEAMNDKDDGVILFTEKKEEPGKIAQEEKIVKTMVVKVAGKEIKQVITEEEEPQKSSWEKMRERSEMMAITSSEEKEPMTYAEKLEKSTQKGTAKYVNITNTQIEVEKKQTTGKKASSQDVTMENERAAMALFRKLEERAPGKYVIRNNRVVSAEILKREQQKKIDEYVRNYEREKLRKEREAEERYQEMVRLQDLRIMAEDAEEYAPGDEEYNEIYRQLWQ